MHTSTTRHTALPFPGHQFIGTPITGQGPPLLTKALQIEDLLAPYEPGHRREDETYDHDGRAIGEEIGVHTQREARQQRYALLLLLAIEEVGCLGALEQRTGLRNAPRTTQAEYVPTKR